MVVAGLDAHDARRLRGAEPERERRPERDRHLADEVAHHPPADDGLDAVDDLDRLEPALQHREQRSLVARVHQVLPGQDPDVGGEPCEPRPLGGPEVREELDTGDLVCGHHGVTTLPKGPCVVTHAPVDLPGLKLYCWPP